MFFNKAADVVISLQHVSNAASTWLGVIIVTPCCTELLMRSDDHELKMCWTKSLNNHLSIWRNTILLSRFHGTSIKWITAVANLDILTAAATGTENYRTDLSLKVKALHLFSTLKQSLNLVLGLHKDASVISFTGINCVRCSNICALWKTNNYLQKHDAIRWIIL